jgi:YesN/AraC family two-component response regulator
MRNILLAEDEAISRLFIRNFVYKFYEGIHIYEAEDGLEAFKMFQENKIDLVVTDITMPNLNGCDLVKKIREIDKNVPIIIESAFNEAYCSDFIKKLINEQIVKPIEPGKFKILISKYL